MTRLNRTVIAYFAMVGVALHLAAGYLMINQPVLFEKLQNAALKRLEAHLPALKLAASEPHITYNLTQEVSTNFSDWAPETETPIDTGAALIRSDQYPSLAQAAAALKDGDTLLISPGLYREALVITAHHTTLWGQGHVILEGVAAEGKAAIVLKGNNSRLRNLECRHIEVVDGNGACVRLEGKHLQLEHVYFHSGQQGLLTGSQSGRVSILDSRFEQLGHRGRAHGIYVGGGELHISHSLFIAAKDQGHEIKSRALLNTIRHSTLTSLSANDSRLIDIPNGGELTVTDSLLHQGPRSSNADLIGFGLEVAPSQSGSVRLERNTIVMERAGSNRLLHLKHPDTPTVIQDNLIIGPEARDLSNGNLTFDSRQAANMPDYPRLTTTTATP